jgi:hypothetical protein
MRIVAVLLVVALTGCTAASEPVAAPPAESEARAPTLVVQTMPPDLAAIPRLRTALPRRIPTDVAAMPALVDDPPGRAIAVYHPPELWPEPVEGWASETLLFFGLDGEWRRLRMNELGLRTRAGEAMTRTAPGACRRTAVGGPASPGTG